MQCNVIFFALFNKDSVNISYSLPAHTFLCHPCQCFLLTEKYTIPKY